MSEIKWQPFFSIINFPCCVLKLNIEWSFEMMAVNHLFRCGLQTSSVSQQIQFDMMFNTDLDPLVVVFWHWSFECVTHPLRDSMMCPHSQGDVVLGCGDLSTLHGSSLTILETSCFFIALHLLLLFVRFLHLLPRVLQVSMGWNLGTWLHGMD